MKEVLHRRISTRELSNVNPSTVIPTSIPPGQTPYPGVEVNDEFVSFLDRGGRMGQPNYANAQM